MRFNQIFEFSMVMDHEKFHKVFKSACRSTGCTEKMEEEYIDRSLEEKGITVIYRDSQYKKKVRILANSGLISGSDRMEQDRFVRKLDKSIGKYFCHKYNVDDFNLSGVAMTADIRVGGRENVEAYLKVLQRIGRVKGFSPVKYESFDDDSCFCLEGNSNGVEFMMYDLERILIGQLHAKNIKKKQLRSAMESSEGVIRVEIRLSKPKTVRNYTDTEETMLQVIEFLEKCQGIFLDVLTKIVPYGDFYKKDKAVDIIRENIRDDRLKRRMLQLVALIPEKKSLYLAQKAMNYRNMEKVMEAFAEINVSPVTISKRQDLRYLKNIYECLLG